MKNNLASDPLLKEEFSCQHNDINKHEGDILILHACIIGKSSRIFSPPHTMLPGRTSSAFFSNFVEEKT
jgi:hypothetical protein